MNLRTAYEIGKNLGAELLDANSEELGKPGAYDGEPQRPEGIVSEAFDHYQQFSPWECTAADFNNSRNPERTWEEFERGMEVGARAAARKYRE